MKRKLFFSTVSAFFLLFLGYGCSDDYLSDREIQQMIDNSLNGQWQIVNITVETANWTWNEQAAQWYAFVDLPELTKPIYEKGAVLGYVFIEYDDGSEVQKLLPYVDTYSAGDDTFTETISVDYQYGNPSTVGFFIKDSELFQDPRAPRTLNFRIVLIW